MSEKRIAANRRNARMSTGPTSSTGKRKSARNALKHGLSISTDPTRDDVRALAQLLLPETASDEVAPFAVEAARRVIDCDRVWQAHQDLYARLGSSPALVDLPSQPPVEFEGLAGIAARLIKEPQPRTPGPLTITDLAKQLDMLARYERRTLSRREKALEQLTDAIAGVRAGD
jgi:hypothetical protein